ncbi:MAG: HAD-IIA family hydrolase [Streptosporangiales bacterium]
MNGRHLTGREGAAVDAQGAFRLPRFRGYALDLDGTVYLGDRLLPGAGAVVRELRERGARVVFVTNKPLESAGDYARKLGALGIEAERADVVTALDSLLHYLRERHAGARILTVAEPLVDRELERAGFAVTRDAGEADVVAVSFDRTFDYAKLTRAFHAVRGGAALVATNPDPFCPTGDGDLPDCAAMLAAIEASAGVRAEAIAGKPSAHMARALVNRLGVAAGESVVVGDRLGTDVAMAAALGMSSVLVLSGATSTEEAARSDVTPDFVVDDVRALLG